MDKRTHAHTHIYVHIICIYACICVRVSMYIMILGEWIYAVWNSIGPQWSWPQIEQTFNWCCTVGISVVFNIQIQHLSLAGPWYINTDIAAWKINYIDINCWVKSPSVTANGVRAYLRNYSQHTIMGCNYSSLPKYQMNQVNNIKTLSPRQNGRHFADDISNAFSWQRSFACLFKFHWFFFLRLFLTISQCWFR